jgi:methyl-accepting chemotaxis protein
LCRIKNLFENEIIKNFLNEYITILENAKDEETILKDFCRDSLVQAIQYTFKQVHNQIPNLSQKFDDKLSDYFHLDKYQKKEFNIRFENSLYAVINRRVYGRININLILIMIAIIVICFLHDLAQNIQQKDNRLVNKIEDIFNLFGDLTLRIENSNFY